MPARFERRVVSTIVAALSPSVKIRRERSRATDTASVAAFLSSTEEAPSNCVCDLSESFLVNESRSRYVLVRDTFDTRDHVYSPDRRQLRAPLPPHVDLRSNCPRVQNQGSIGTCTAHVLAAGYAYEQRVQKKRVITPSRLFIYYNERALTHQRGLNCVVRLRDAIKAVAKRGVCPESLWPYSEAPNTLRKRPPREAFETAASHKIVEYNRIPNENSGPGMFLKHLKHCLTNRRPFLFGFMLYESFETKEVKRSGIMPFPDRRRERPLGGHAVMAVGYDDRRKAVLARNSWGPNWGIAGYFWMPYRLISDPEFAYDFWSIRGVTS